MFSIGFLVCLPTLSLIEMENEMLSEEEEEEEEENKVTCSVAHIYICIVHGMDMRLRTRNITVKNICNCNLLWRESQVSAVVGPPR